MAYFNIGISTDINLGFPGAVCINDDPEIIRAKNRRVDIDRAPLFDTGIDEIMKHGILTYGLGTAVTDCHHNTSIDTCAGALAHRKESYSLDSPIPPWFCEMDSMPFIVKAQFIFHFSIIVHKQLRFAAIGAT
jgi:hypothetical protein